MTDELAWWNGHRNVSRAFFSGPFGQIHYRIAGSKNRGAKPPLLFFHQSPSSGRVFEPLLDIFGEDRISIAVDTPGFGDSDPLPVIPRIEDYAAIAGDLIDGLGIDIVDLFGDHTGTKIAAEFAFQRPQQVRRIVMNAALVFPDSYHARQREILAKEKSISLAPTLASHLEYWRNFTEAYRTDTPVELINRDFAETLRAGEHRWYGHNASFRYDMRRALSSVPHPILQLCPNDGYFDMAKQTAALMRNAEVLELPGYRMGALSLEAEYISRIVRRFLDGDHGTTGYRWTPRQTCVPSADKPIIRKFVKTSLGQAHLRVAKNDTFKRIPLVCLHRFPLNGRYFERLLIEMAHDRPSVAIDIPGFGESDKPEGSATVTSIAGIMAEAIEAQGWSKVDVLGDHEGGSIALELASQRPDLVRRCVVHSGASNPGAESKIMWGERAGTHLPILWAYAAKSAPLTGSSNQSIDQLFCDVMRAGPRFWSPSPVAFQPGSAAFRRVDTPTTILRAEDARISDWPDLSAPTIHLHRNANGTVEGHWNVIARQLRGFLDDPF